MKRILLAINLVLCMAVAYLYYLHFMEAKTNDSEDLTTILAKTPLTPGGIYFVNSDSLLDNYDFYKHKKLELEKRQERIKAELKLAGQKLQADVEKYQQSAPGMSADQRQQAEESLMARQQQLVQQKDELLSKLDEEQSQSSDSLFIRLTSFLKEFNKGKSVHFVLGYQRGGGILYANDSLDITRPVLQGLNKKWKAETGTN
jgi:outer membrane protein